MISGFPPTISTSSRSNTRSCRPADDLHPASLRLLISTIVTWFLPAGHHLKACLLRFHVFWEPVFGIGITIRGSWGHSPPNGMLMVFFHQHHSCYLRQTFILVPSYFKFQRFPPSDESKFQQWRVSMIRYFYLSPLLPAPFYFFGWMIGKRLAR